MHLQLPTEIVSREKAWGGEEEMRQLVPSSAGRGPNLLKGVGGGKLMDPRGGKMTIL